MAFFTESTNVFILVKSRTNDTNSFVGWLPISMSWVLLTPSVMPITITLQPRIIAGSASNFCHCHLFLAVILSFLFEHVSLPFNYLFFNPASSVGRGLLRCSCASVYVCPLTRHLKNYLSNQLYFCWESSLWSRDETIRFWEKKSARGKGWCGCSEISA